MVVIIPCGRVDVQRAEAAPEFDVFINKSWSRKNRTKWSRNALWMV